MVNFISHFSTGFTSESVRMDVNSLIVTTVESMKVSSFDEKKFEVVVMTLILTFRMSSTISRI